MYVGEGTVIPDVAYATAAIRSHTLPLTSVLRFPLESLDGRELKNLNHVALPVQRAEVCYVAAAIVSGILDCKGSALGIVGEDHDLGRAVCVSMLFLALKISLIWFYQKCCKQRKCMCMIQNIAGSRK